MNRVGQKKSQPFFFTSAYSPLFPELDVLFQTGGKPCSSPFELSACHWMDRRLGIALLAAHRVRCRALPRDRRSTETDVP